MYVFKTFETFVNEVPFYEVIEFSSIIHSAWKSIEFFTVDRDYQEIITGLRVKRLTNWANLHVLVRVSLNWLFMLHFIFEFT